MSTVTNCGCTSDNDPVSVLPTDTCTSTQGACCVFYNYGDDLDILGVTPEENKTLCEILKLIDTKLGVIVADDYSSFNTYCVETTGGDPITTPQEWVEGMSKAFCDYVTATDTTLGELEAAINTINSTFSTKVSDSIVESVLTCANYPDLEYVTNDTLEETLDKLRSAICAIYGEYLTEVDLSSITWGCLSTQTTVKATLQAIITKLCTINTTVTNLSSALGTVQSFAFTNGNGFTGTVVNSTTTPTLSLVLQDATSVQSGQLTSTDWNTFNNKVSSPWLLNGAKVYYSAGNVGLCTNNPLAALHIIKTSEILRLGYNGTNYCSTTISANGSVSNSITSTSGVPTFDWNADFVLNTLSIGLGGGLVATNTVCGAGGLANNTTGLELVAVGYGALAANTIADYCTAVGVAALYTNVDGDYNTAVGNSALSLNESGGKCTAVGYKALYACLADTNTAIGYEAGSAHTTGTNNTFIGHGATGAAITDSNKITLGNGSITHLRCQVTSITALSDKRDKKDIKELEYGLDFVTKLKPVEFTWETRDGSKSGIKDSGFIAQDLQELENETGAKEVLNLVMDSNPDKLEATYGHLIPVLVKAIQDLKKEFDDYKISHP